MTTMMLLPMFLVASLSNYGPVSQLPSDTEHVLLFLFFFLSHKLFYTPYVHFGSDAKDCLESWTRKKKRGGDCGEEKKGRKHAIFCLFLFHKQNPSKCATDILMNPIS